MYCQFDTLTVESVPPMCQKTGTKYVYEWNEDSKRDDWWADGYRNRKSLY